MNYLILAGGGGTRLWPVSRKNKPKQNLPFVNDQTLLQTTFERLKKFADPKQIYIATNIKQKKAVKKQLPDFREENFILEIENKDTAAAIGYAAVKFLAEDEQSFFVTINSDAYIQDEQEYRRMLKLAEKVIVKYPQKTVLIGVKPTYPETGYGYIKMASQVDKFSDGRGGDDEIFEVEKFVEKPDLTIAKKYVEQWEYLWNPAIFVWQTKNLLLLFQKYLPKHYEILIKIKENLKNKKIIQEQFKKFDPVSIDYGIMEKLANMLVIPADFGWTDIGNWKTIKDVLSKSSDNLIKGKFISHDNLGNLVYNYTDRLIAGIGLKDMIIIQTDDVTLICPKDKAQEVKKIVNQLKDQNKDEYL